MHHRASLFALLLAAAPVASAQEVARAPVAAARRPVAPWQMNAPVACAARVFGGHNYYFCPGDMAFDAARTYCRSFGTDLATFESRYENDAVAEVVRALNRGRHLIGHHDRVTEGRFETVLGTPSTFSAWASGEPNNVGDEDCVHLGDYGWNDVPCVGDVKNAFICETGGG